VLPSFHFQILFSHLPSTALFAFPFPV
jgi:hypothetical protein